MSVFTLAIGGMICCLLTNELIGKRRQSSHKECLGHSIHKQFMDCNSNALRGQGEVFFSFFFLVVQGSGFIWQEHGLECIFVLPGPLKITSDSPGIFSYACCECVAAFVPD